MEPHVKLQRARVERGMTLSQISTTTKMSTHVLERIESGRFDELPGGLLTRGYLRAFAREVGLDPEEIVREYRAESGPASLEDQPFTLPTSYADTDGRGRGAGILFTIALAVILYGVFVRPSDKPSEIDPGVDTAAIAVDVTPTIERTVLPAPMAQRRAALPASADPEGLRVELRPQADCWVSATADGHSVIYRLMHAGERETIDAARDIVLRVGDAGALTYVVNGSAGRSLGASGEAVTVRITTDNLATWLTTDPPAPPTDTLLPLVSSQQVTGI